LLELYWSELAWSKLEQRMPDRPAGRS